MADVNVDPNSYNQGLYAGTAAAAGNLSQYQKAGDIMRADASRNDISNISNEYAKIGKKLELEDLKNVYAKNGDLDSLERIDQRILARDAQVFEAKSKIYLDQINAAQAAGNNDALLAIEQNMNTDPAVKRFIGDLKIQPDNSVSYVLNKDVPVTMTGGKIEQGQAGDQVIAYATKDKNGNTVYFAKEIKPSTVSKYRYAGTGAGGGKPLDTLPVIKLVDGAIDGKMNDGLGIYEQGIKGLPQVNDAVNKYLQTTMSMQTERLNNRRNPDAINNEQIRLDTAMANRIIAGYQKWKATKKNKYATPEEAFAAYMKDNNIDPKNFNLLTSLLRTTKEREVEQQNNAAPATNNQPAQ